MRVHAHALRLSVRLSVGGVRLSVLPGAVAPGSRSHARRLARFMCPCAKIFLSLYYYIDCAASCAVGCVVTCVVGCVVTIS